MAVGKCNVGGGLSINGATNVTGVVAPNESIVSGDVLEFLSDGKLMKQKTKTLGKRLSTLYGLGLGYSLLDVVCLSDSKFLVLYQRQGDSCMVAKVITKGAGTISGGSDLVLTAFAASGLVRLIRLSDTSAMAVFYNAGNEIYGIALTISGTTISNGSAYLLSTGTATANFDVCLMDTNKVLFVFSKYASNYVYSAVLTVSGTTITINTQYSLTTASSLGTKYNLSMLASDKAILFFNDGGYFKSVITSLS